MTSSEPSPTFVMCAARSGSTLLRLMLNSHPEIYCPAETNISSVFDALAFTSRNIDSVERGETDAELCRLIAERTIGAEARAHGKLRWADKSLIAIDHADLLASVFPNAHYICLYRECGDMVASLHEACVWGYGGYGIEPYVRQAPQNLPMALVQFWIDRATAIRQFEEAHAAQCIRVRYEDLVTDPEDTLRRIFESIGARKDGEAVANAVRFKTPRGAVMGDLKVQFTDSVRSDSVGRGWTIPTEMLSDEVRERAAALAAELGYPPLRNIRDGVGGFVPSGDEEAGSSRDDVVGLLASFAEGQPDVYEAEPDVKLVLADWPETWIVDLGREVIYRGSGDARWTALTDCETLARIVSGELSAGVAIREATLRVAGTGDEPPAIYIDRINSLVRLLRERASYVISAVA